MIIEDCYLRSELNGLSVYDRKMDLYMFFENVQMPGEGEFPDKAAFYTYLMTLGTEPSLSLSFGNPFKINWMVTDRCNLSCVYCIANNKMDLVGYSSSSVFETADRILALHPLTVTLSGGDPMLLKNLPELIDHIAGKASITLDTNGTIPFTDRHLESVRNAGVLVRISLDSLDEEINSSVRPGGALNVMKILSNIRLLKENDIPVYVHTVVTQENYQVLMPLGDILHSLGITKWHLYGLIRNGKAKLVYDKYAVDDEILLEITKQLQKAYPTLNVSSTPSSTYYEKFTTPSNPERSEESTLSGKSGGTSLMVDFTGRFFVELWNNTPEYIGEDPKNPSLKEIHQKMDVDSYIHSYYGPATNMDSPLAQCLKNRNPS